ncbi:phosphatase PAP2 family protein [Colwellia sp. 4_MG-2023]|uniref:phosphatase PAP2 family protein n=1 Tax=unclassified Colwellia TaxID=196834 RepID=UPI002091E47D|nr:MULTISPECIES: phosphatase PAP2 family protein [unclassified Colwellia]MDO6489443.1 phosphatase PAP2 family protein [Colwellia sp. 6_MG-2023]MDO6508493.1 phosphatase PAP2 family protein [Colwellia sp. 5_MG-2023]MDO6557108.1 phosphatase PAP2 family protein [Colwellia sp. 4_MG-2023]MDO6652332.1 phosphatase PAP2 family protein [Colwellia sp. 3_MG-2023]MDO6666908.1 phosphatase PAP2 family protein [Colwellia sp. 2_MG-2023]
MLNDIYQYDLRVLLWCRKSRFYPQFIAMVRIISRTGDGYMQFLLPLCYWLISPQEGKRFVIILLWACAIERLLYFVLKNSLKRRRPPEIVTGFTSVIEASDQFSFPSGHTMAAFLLANLCVLELGLIASPLYFWATSVAISRVILGVHFPTDTLVGATLGSSIAYVVVMV